MDCKISYPFFCKRGTVELIPSESHDYVDKNDQSWWEHMFSPRLMELFHPFWIYQGACRDSKLHVFYHSASLCAGGYVFQKNNGRRTINFATSLLRRSFLFSFQYRIPNTRDMREFP